MGPFLIYLIVTAEERQELQVCSVYTENNKPVVKFMSLSASPLDI